jgi:cytochrome c553
MPLSRRCTVGILFLSLTLGTAAPAFAAGDAANGKVLSYTCLGCHGIDNYKNVYPTYSVPELYGQHAGVPDRRAQGVSQWRALARHHAYAGRVAVGPGHRGHRGVFRRPELKPTKSTVGTPPAKVAQLCVACHGADGVGIMGDYPTLAGQHADYLARALDEYKHGDRKNAVMPSFMTAVSEAEIQEIADYYSRQTPPLRTEPRRVTILSAQ